MSDSNPSKSSANDRESRRFMRKRGLCEYLDCGPTFVNNLVARGDLTPIRLSQKCTVYDLDQVDTLIAKRRSAATPEAEQ